MQKSFLKIYSWFYKYLIKETLFLFDPEFIHEAIVSYGDKLGSNKLAKLLVRKFFYVQNKILHQKIAGIDFGSPVGLAAGLDYQAKLIKILPALSFGFQTIGTITNRSYEGNPKPRLGRLVKSKSLMVNKGFKNPGVREIVKRLQKNKFETPVGISIGQTNSAKEKTQKGAAEDIISAFRAADNAKVPFSYYELNISCPNLLSKVSFYPPGNLRDLLEAVTALRLKKPLFVKMPISKTDQEIKAMLNVIIKFPVAGVIIGNVQTNRKDKSLDQDEVKRFPMGNFSGKSTEQRSNELIALAYELYGKRLIIIGCGGIFNAEDAYRKIKLGATLVQLITGLIFEGPQLVSEINLGLVELLKKDGFNNISAAIGTDPSLRS